MERRPISVSLRKIKINDIKTVIFFTTLKVIYFLMQITTKSSNKPIKVSHIKIRVHLTKLWAFKDGKKAHFSNHRKIKINDIKTVIFFTTFKVLYFNADNNKIIQQPIKVCHIKIRVHLTKLWAFKDGKKAHFSKPSQN